MVRREHKRFTLRMDIDTFEAISMYAEKHKRAIGREIEVAIEQYINDLESKETEKGVLEKLHA